MACKIVCDICGRDADSQEFVVPYLKTYRAEYDGVTVKTWDRIDTCRLNLCGKHRRQIGLAVRTLKDEHNKV